MRKITFTLNPTAFTLLIFLTVALFSAAFFGTYKLYLRVVATEKMQQELIRAQEQERINQEEKAQVLLAAQERELALTQEELKKTRTDAENNNAKIQTLTETIQNQSKVVKDTVITSNDLLPYMTGVVQVVCSSPSGISSGSGSLFTFKEMEQAVLTNYHVVKDASKCVIVMTNTANTPTGMFAAQGEIYTFNKETDQAVLGIGQAVSAASVPIANYNYSLASVRKCPSPLPVGTPVVIIGYPSYARRDSTINIQTIGTVNVVYRTTTNGIISGYDTSGQGDANYFVSAKIDAGNSGGIALAKDELGLCVLGLPTWLTMGNYETQGLVQNISNVLPQ